MRDGRPQTGKAAGADTISAYADTNTNGTRDSGEPSDAATKSWVLPASTVGCKVTNGGAINTAGGDTATIGGNAQAAISLKGSEEYTDQGPTTPIKVKSLTPLALTWTIGRTDASVFGIATVNGVGPVGYRIDVHDRGEPGANDTYRLRLGNGYDSGERTLAGGNVQIQ